MIHLRGPSKEIYVLKPGVLDERAQLAFLAGQCHGLALALHLVTSWPLVAVLGQDGTHLHVCVRDPAGRLVDVTGAHNEREIRRASPSSVIEPIDARGIEELVSKFGWAEPDVTAAEAWVAPVLAQMSRPPCLPPLKSPCYRRTVRTNRGILVRFIWAGDPSFTVQVQREGDPPGEWITYSRVQFPLDPETGGYLIDFSPDSFEAIAEAWLAHQFDAEKAERRLDEGAAGG